MIQVEGINENELQLYARVVYILFKFLLFPGSHFWQQNFDEHKSVRVYEKDTVHMYYFGDVVVVDGFVRSRTQANGDKRSTHEKTG